MSTLEKVVSLLREMPEQKIEAVYAYAQDIFNQQSHVDESAAFGIAHKYAAPALMDQEKGAFERAMAEKHEAN